MLRRTPTFAPQRNRLSKATSFPKIGDSAHANVSTCRSELDCIVNQVGDDVLKLELVKQDRLQASIWPEFPSESLLLEAARPMLQNLRNALVHITEFLGDADLARFKRAECEKILNETLQTKPALLHFLQDFPLLLVEWPQQLTQK